MIMTRLAVPTGIAALVASAIPVVASPHASQRPRDVGRGDIISAQKIRDIPRNGVSRRLERDGWDASRVRFGVTAYRVVYRTVDVAGKPTRASGLVVLPRSQRHRLRLVSYAHGTTSYKPDVASNLSNDFVVSPALSYGSAGFAAASPDYLGLGKGPGTHPWMHVSSETTASIDMLRATRELVRRQGRALHKGVYLTGFSQGASAALGTARRLQRVPHRWFHVGAAGAISGAYDLADVEVPAMLEGRLDPKMAVAYAAYLLVAWDRIYDLYASPSELVKQPYADRIEGLFDGTTPGQDMLAALPDTLDDLLTARGHRSFAHPSMRLRRAMRTADSVCKNWRPRRPIRLFVARDDEQAASANTSSCSHSFRESGATAPITRLGTPDYDGSRHLGSNVAGTAATMRWFLRLDELHR
ncbi:MAG TPA: hypothetical protein VK059_02735 [Nocardioidaceae bacterium]|nr:hypothetical protein [Nocardioidaceae bacterium]